MWPTGREQAAVMCSDVKLLYCMQVVYVQYIAAAYIHTVGKCARSYIRSLCRVLRLDAQLAWLAYLCWLAHLVHF
jgi:hypothetical protein